jgi:hypothetical protein
MDKCDICGQIILGETVEVRLARPSNPRDLCVILAYCQSCQPAYSDLEWLVLDALTLPEGRSFSGVALASVWEDFYDSPAGRRYI